MYGYNKSVSKLINFGFFDEESEFKITKELGLTAQDIPELIRLAVDTSLLHTDNEEYNMEYNYNWSNINAWIALKELKAETGIEYLYHYFLPDSISRFRII